VGFTKTDNCWLDRDNGLTNAEFRVIMILERLLTGFHRKTYKIAYSEISEMSGVKNVYLVMKRLKEKGFVSFKYESGRTSKIQIHKPSKLVSRSSTKVSNSVSTTIEVNDTHHRNNLYDTPLAKENYKENLKKDLFLEFKKKYPEDKFDDDTALDAWQSLTDADKQLVLGVMEYQNNGWTNIDHKYIPKASNYLLKRKFLDEGVRGPYESEIRREKNKINQREYYQKSDQNSATPEEIKEILQSGLKPSDKQQNNNGRG